MHVMLAYINNGLDQDIARCMFAYIIFQELLPSPE